MDQHGIDMQILSYSNPSQNAPAEVQVQLTRRALLISRNDKEKMAHGNAERLFRMAR